MRILTIDLGEKTPEIVHAVLQELATAYDVEREPGLALERCVAGACTVAVLCVDASGPAEAAFAAQLRDAGGATPLLVVAGRANAQDMVSALDGGADDYLPGERPPAELAARVRALARREPQAATTLLEYGDLRLDPAAHRAWRGGRELALTALQFTLLETFLRHSGRALSRGQLLDLVWDPASDTSSNVVDQAIAALRRAIGKDRVITVRGVGYRLGDGA
ncbi:winged helix family transcriptional regulator [Cumulibacter manganitolerans]|uniref:winged helix family transcriptional regulator n=1 Tax=Cumulibacter manganitolerans TaxID=1884992 RepID=UPI001885E347|nr:response regulator transcription factor [Cumulibacter manganitolerans]